jgi:hypothetical protein
MTEDTRRDDLAAFVADARMYLSRGFYAMAIGGGDGDLRARAIERDYLQKALDFLAAREAKLAEKDAAIKRFTPLERAVARVVEQSQEEGILPEAWRGLVRAVEDYRMLRETPDQPAKADEPPIESDCDDHRLEAFHLICRDCGSRAAYFARRAGFVGKPMSAICPQCGIWEIIE